MAGGDSLLASCEWIAERAHSVSFCDIVHVVFLRDAVFFCFDDFNHEAG